MISEVSLNANILWFHDPKNRTYHYWVLVMYQLLCQALWIHSLISSPQCPHQKMRIIIVPPSKLRKKWNNRTLRIKPGMKEVSFFLFLITQNSLYGLPKVYPSLRAPYISWLHPTLSVSSFLMALSGDHNNLSFSSQPLLVWTHDLYVYTSHFEGCYFPQRTQHSEWLCCMYTRLIFHAHSFSVCHYNLSSSTLNLIAPGCDY